MASYKKERKFFKCYGLLKAKVKGAREAIKVEVDKEELWHLMKVPDSEESDMVQIYDDFRSHETLIREVRDKMDRACAMVQDTLNVLEEVIGSLSGP